MQSLMRDVAKSIYLAEKVHEPIIDWETFQLVQWMERGIKKQ